MAVSVRKQWLSDRTSTPRRIRVPAAPATSRALRQPSQSSQSAPLVIARRYRFTVGGGLLVGSVAGTGTQTVLAHTPSQRAYASSSRPRRASSCPDVIPPAVRYSSTPP